jgi:hypothetical protein
MMCDPGKWPESLPLTGLAASMSTTSPAIPFQKLCHNTCSEKLERQLDALAADGIPTRTLPGSQATLWIALSCQRVR